MYGIRRYSKESLSQSYRLREDRRGDIVVVLLQHTVSRGAMHILEIHTGIVLVDHVVVRHNLGSPTASGSSRSTVMSERDTLIFDENNTALGHRPNPSLLMVDTHDCSGGLQWRTPSSSMSTGGKLARMSTTASQSRYHQYQFKSNPTSMSSVPSKGLQSKVVYPASARQWTSKACGRALAG